jgi:hypothetical protein
MEGGRRLMARGRPPAPRSLRPCHEPPPHDIEREEVGGRIPLYDRAALSFETPSGGFSRLMITRESRGLLNTQSPDVCL